MYVPSSVKKTLNRVGRASINLKAEDLAELLPLRDQRDCPFLNPANRSSSRVSVIIRCPVVGNRMGEQGGSLIAFLAHLRR